MKAKAERIPARAALALPIAGLHNLFMHVSTSHLEIKLNASFQRYCPPARGFQHRPAQKDKVEKKCPCYNDGVESCAKSFANQGAHQLTRELLTQVDVMYVTRSCNMATGMYLKFAATALGAACAIGCHWQRQILVSGEVFHFS
ncbi:unnamed protein product [Durusdinium trenchii]|uniref:Uncharacterized protein n=1 Tax=Durusdinium trenchii TaxID=1381693 RepID=A0ABP0L8Z1_9DINO